MKIGIVTLYGNNNYGNKLQNYALQEILKELFPNCEIKTLISSDLRIKTIIKNKIKTILRMNKNSKRVDNFLNFNKYIDYDKKIVNIYSPKVQGFDLLIFGSDQIWNTSMEGKTKFFAGYFAKKIKKISYAASFGKNDVDNKYKDLYKKSLMNFKALSVREERGKKIIKDLVDRKDVEVLVDPTLLLSKEKWDLVIKKPKMLHSKKYILLYFLGDLTYDRKKSIDEIAIKNKCDVINILDQNSDFYNTGPSEFLYLIKNAFAICTDSFHACIFSIIYDKPFIVYERLGLNYAMNSRIETLLSKFSIENRKYNDVNITQDNLKHDYSVAYGILKKEREKSTNFLKKWAEEEKI